MRIHTKSKNALRVVYKLHTQFTNRKKLAATLLTAFFIGFSNLVSGQQPLAGTDDLGRTLPQNIEVGDPKSDREVALFYFLWQGDKNNTPTNFVNYDLNDIVSDNPSVLTDFDNSDWGWTDNTYPVYYYGKSVYDYYKGDDYWVHLKNVQLLTDAGVDILMLDATNGPVYFEEADALMSAIEDVQAQGKNPPKVAFYTNSFPPGSGVSGAVMQIIYDNFYKSGATYYHPNTWYLKDSKPLIVGISSEASGKDYQSYFTFRESQWPTEAQKTNGWPWMEFLRPQRVYSNSSSQREIVNVSTAQHPGGSMGISAFYGATSNWGRSYREGALGNPASETPYGYNFQEQWDFAIAQEVPYIFVTGWNELIVGRFPGSVIGVNPEHSVFVDGANAEFSRDIEPSREENLKDNYYMQLVANIRKYKGIDSTLILSDTTTISAMNDWSSVSPGYSDYTGDIIDRDHPSGLRTPNNILSISDEGFESPVIASSPGYVYNPSGGSWSFSTLTGIVKNAGGFGNPNAVEGTQAAFIQQDGSFEQTLSFPADAEYTLLFNVAQRSGYQETFDIYCDSIKIGSWGEYNTNTSYALSRFLFTTTAGNHTIKFVGTKTTADACFIDDIYIGSSQPIHYTNTTGRNDIDTLKVARNDANLYFYAKTVSNIITNSSDNWMNLYLDIDRNPSTGWNGYDYRVIGGTQLQKWGSTTWSNSNTISYVVSGNEMYYTIPKSYIEGLSESLDLEFKWSDNMQDDSDPLDWYINGDAAPGARFNFIATDQTKEERKLGVYNGSFEKPYLADGTFEDDPASDSWVYSAGSGVAHNGSSLSNPKAPEGNQCGYIEDNSTFYQDINFKAGSYKITFFAALGPSSPQQAVDVSIDNVSVGTITPTSLSFEQYATNDFEVTSGVYRVSFSGANTSGQSVFIDYVNYVDVEPQPANLSVGGFELPSLSSSTFQYNPTANGWTYSATSGVANNGSAFNNPTAPEGVQCGFVQNNSTIYQDISFSAGTYSLTCYAAQRPDGSDQTLIVTIDNEEVGTINPSTTSFQPYSTANFSVDAGVHRVTFTGTNVTGETAFIDNVELVPREPELSKGGFETPVLTPTAFQYNPTPNGWTYSTLSGVASNGSAFNNPTAAEGVQCGFLQKDSEIYQDFIFEDDFYKITFMAALRPSNSQTINVYFDDVLVGNVVPSSSTEFLFYSTDSFKAKAGTHRIKFKGTDTTNQTAFIDDVRLVHGSNIAAKTESGVEIEEEQILSDQSMVLEEMEHPFAIYPNPVTDILKINSLGTISIVEIFNMNGKLMFNEAFNTPQIEINVAQLKGGMYVVRVTDDKQRIHAKIIIVEEQK